MPECDEKEPHSGISILRGVSEAAKWNGRCGVLSSVSEAIPCRIERDTVLEKRGGRVNQFWSVSARKVESFRLVQRATVKLQGRGDVAFE